MGTMRMMTVVWIRMVERAAASYYCRLAFFVCLFYSAGHVGPLLLLEMFNLVCVRYLFACLVGGCSRDGHAGDRQRYWTRRSYAVLGSQAASGVYCTTYAFWNG